MKPASRWARRGAIALGLLVVVALIVGAWGVPRLIAGRLRATFHGPAEFDGWWIGWNSAGVTGLALREGPGDESPAWLTADRVSTDLSLAGLLRGRFAPRTVDLRGAKLALRFEATGELLTKGPFEGGGGEPASLPDVTVKGGSLTIIQRGRPPMSVGGISGRLEREEDVEDLSLDSDDAEWGRWTVRGRFDAGFKSGSATLASGPGFACTPDRTARVPFVPAEVWQHVVPTGAADVAVVATLTEGAPKPFHVRTELRFRDARAALPTLGIVAEGTTGGVVVDGGLVRIDDLKGRSLGGSIGARGALDFRGAAPTFDVNLTLDGIDVAKAPASWQLGEVGASGRLTGTARLLVALKPDGPDLTGSTGEAVIDGAVLQGIPIKSLRLAMQAQGTDLKYGTKQDGKTSALSPPTLPSPARGEGFLMSSDRNLHPPPLWGRVVWGVIRAMTARLLVALRQQPKAPAPRFHLPESITTQIELEDVNLKTLLDRLEVATKIRPPVPVAGKLSVKASATIPLGHLADLKGYTIRGTATLKGATIDNVDLGRLSARFALVKGVLDLDDLSGQLVERPGGTAASPAPTAEGPAPGAALQPGAFRGTLHAELSPAGRLAAKFEARDLPLAELAAPFFPVPTPVGGRITTSFDASGDVARLGDAAAWTVHGRVSSDRASYRDAVLDGVSSRFAIEAARLTVPDLAARLGGNPLGGELTLDLGGDRPFAGRLDVKGWAIERVLALVPGAPDPAPASGVVDGEVAFRGTLRPLAMTSDGRVAIRGAEVESIPLGDVAARWATRDGVVVVDPVTARPFGGEFSGRATIPDRRGPPIKVDATFAEVRLGELAQSLTRGQLALAGTAGGKLDATIPSDPKALAIDVTLSAPDLTVQGVPAGSVSAAIRGKGEVIEYALEADGPLGKVRFKGDVPLGGPAPEKPANAEVRASDIRLRDLARLIGFDGYPAPLRGLASVDANLRALRPDPSALGVHGLVELRDLRWGDRVPIGDLRGIVARTADGWRLDEVRGDLLGGVATGDAWGDTPANGRPTVDFRLATDRADLARMLAFVPWLGHRAEGFATLRIAGRMEEALAARAELSAIQANLAGLTIADLRMPAEFAYHPAESRGTLRLERWTARVAGGRAQGSGWLRTGLDQSFETDLTLADADLESLLRFGSSEVRPGSGKVNARVAVAGTDPARPRSYRGRVEVRVHDASIGDVPVIRGLDRFLGASQGGAFEAGQLRGTVSDGRLLVDDLRMEGRVLQIHATGAVTFSGAVDLAVLVNTNQLIPETGEALVGLIPGLRQVINRDAEARLRVANYLSNRLLKFRVGGTVRNPNITPDRGIGVGDAAVGFFSGVLRLPLGLVK